MVCFGILSAFCADIRVRATFRRRSKQARLRMEGFRDIIIAKLAVSASGIVMRNL